MALSRALERVTEVEIIGAIPCLWPKDRPRYVVAVRLQETPGKFDFDCVGLSIFPLEPGTRVNAGVLRGLPVGALIDEAIRRVLNARLAEAEGEIVNPATTPLDEDFARNRDAFWRDRAAAIVFAFDHGIVQPLA